MIVPPHKSAWILAALLLAACDSTRDLAGRPPPDATIAVSKVKLDSIPSGTGSNRKYLLSFQTDWSIDPADFRIRTYQLLVPTDTSPRIVRLPVAGGSRIDTLAFSSPNWSGYRLIVDVAVDLGKDDHLIVGADTVVVP